MGRLGDGERLDAGGGQIGDPAGEGPAPRLALGPEGKSHALDAAGDDDAGGGDGHRAAQANSRMTWSTARLSPVLARTVLTLPSRSARSTFSIFIASTTASSSPALTSCPSPTASETRSPGIGDSRKRDRSGGSLARLCDSR